MKGGKLILENAKAIALFNLKTIAKKITRRVWKPQIGDNPIKIPKAIEKLFLDGESWLPKKSSIKKRLILYHT